MLQWCALKCLLCWVLQGRSLLSQGQCYQCVSLLQSLFCLPNWICLSPSLLPLLLLWICASWFHSWSSSWLNSFLLCMSSLIHCWETTCYFHWRPLSFLWSFLSSCEALHEVFSCDGINLCRPSVVAQQNDFGIVILVLFKVFQAPFGFLLFNLKTPCVSWLIQAVTSKEKYSGDY